MFKVLTKVKTTGPHRRVLVNCHLSGAFLLLQRGYILNKEVNCSSVFRDKCILSLSKRKITEMLFSCKVAYFY